jgi:hypothetical protein
LNLIDRSDVFLKDSVYWAAGRWRLVKKSGDVIDLLLSPRVVHTADRLMRTLGGLVDVTARNRTNRRAA